MSGAAGEFEAFVRTNEPRLRRALVAAYGSERGRDAVAEALAYAWEHWPTVSVMARPVPYLYRVGQSKTRPRRRRVIFEPVGEYERLAEPSLSGALERLSRRQRLAVVLVHGFGWSLREVAELQGCSVSTVQTQADRGMRSLRRALNVDLNRETMEGN